VSANWKKIRELKLKPKAKAKTGLMLDIIRFNDKIEGNLFE
jgi:hypothetical protein